MNPARFFLWPTLSNNLRQRRDVIYYVSTKGSLKSKGQRND